MRAAKNIWVYADWIGINGPRLMGQLRADVGREGDIFSFTYDEQWLKEGPALSLDPDLGLYNGPQFTREEKSSFGIFTDSAPDRWGRVLMERKESYNARLEKRAPKKLFESDYLLGVADFPRMGGIRFKLDPDGPFLDSSFERAAPPIHNIRTLEAASLEIEQDNARENPRFGEWMRILLAPGTSLGGARPKASITDTNGHLWIAKFPSRFDEYDIGIWEAVVMQLANGAGINIAVGRAEQYTARHHTYLTKRFDRTEEGRIHFASAMTLLGLTDGADGNDGISYQHIAEFIMKSGANPNENMKELWKRMVFNICVSNTDDHLRNHGFLLTSGGWVLSPAYDINPVLYSEHLKLNISEDSGILSLDLALQEASAFRLSNQEAKTLMDEIIQSVSTWQQVAETMGISRGDIEYMESAFDLSAKK
ncbi:serine/threonine-protein kinase HipA [Chitinophaga eiseniae]|uniref:Serine/threonine-protein kinase HipA n=1 Tax=Chitinophaga eiseniae TaxID=634771 RepID=A0A1T4QMZ9_9BACT|nr:HipA domain-containing protein [Chitinophaga eiseniae]SKA05150.1 serine/threonine-protein kinase HipA [Chitinophaga eiseniae]